MVERRRKDTKRIAEEAAEWIEALQEGGAETHAPFVAWLRASPRHIEEFLLITALDAEARSIDSERSMHVRHLLEEAAMNVVPLSETSQPLQPRGRRGGGAFTLRWSLATAACATLAALGWWMLFGPGSWSAFTTGIGEQRIVQLEDGSVMRLNAHSQLRVRMSAERRDVRLIEGEALFEVAKDATRPFVVRTQDALVQAVGTEFNVYRRDNRTTVSVLEGTVKVAHLGEATAAPGNNDGNARAEVSTSTSNVGLFVAGEQARVARGVDIERAPLDVAAATAWRERRLIFRDNSLAEIADEFNRYNRNLRIIVDDDTARARRYGGTFDADDPGSFIDYLEPDASLVIQRLDGEIVIRERTIRQR